MLFLFLTFEITLVTYSYSLEQKEKQHNYHLHIAKILMLEKTISLSIGNNYQLLEFMKMEKAKDEQLTFRKVWSS